MNDTIHIEVGKVDETTTSIEDDRIVLLTISHDQDAENPLDGGAMETIHSYNRRHRNFDPDAANAAMRKDRDAVVLSYYEHGLCAWGVAGELGKIPGVEFEWDGTQVAGVWIPDEEARQEANESGMTPEERRRFMQERATTACGIYTDYCNGSVYGYKAALYALERDENGETIEDPDYYARERDPKTEDACWGFYGIGDATNQARSAVKTLLRD